MQNELKIREVILCVFSTFWIGLLLIDYWDKHPLYWISITHFKYVGWSLILLGLGVITSLYCAKLSFFSRIEKPFFNGLMVLGLFIICLVTTAFFFNQYFQAELNFSHYWHLVSRSMYTLLCSLFLLISANSTGKVILKRLFNTSAIGGITAYLIHTAIGFFLLNIGLFLLGSFGFLTQIPVLIWLLIFPLINYKNTLTQGQIFLTRPFSLDSSWNFWGYFVMFVGLVYSSINFFFVQAPFPLGFDARNYYVNISKLLSESGSLIEGFQPYAWSLFTSVGYIVFLSPEITMFLSTIGGYLTCWGIYELAVRYFKLDKNYALLAALMFMITPAINNHWIVEFKIDLALLFVQFTILNLLFYWFFEKKEESSSLLITDINDWKILSIISVLMGFSLSIKVLSIFLTFSVFLIMWLYSRDKIGTIGIASIGISLTILLKLDEISGLRGYHESPNTTAFIFIGLGILLLAASFFKHGYKQLIQNVKPIILSLIIMLTCFTPWLIKNYNESSKKDIVSIILGAVPAPDVELGEMLNNYKNANK